MNSNLTSLTKPAQTPQNDEDHSSDQNQGSNLKQKVNHTSSATIFRQGSTTYFYSSLFFPQVIKEKVNDLYAFVRTADDFVDATPQDKAGFLHFRSLYEQSQRTSALTQNSYINNFAQLSTKNNFDPAWTEAFLDSMQLDLTQRDYSDFASLENYIYGSAEVVGLYLAQILNLPPESLPYARMLGKAMQYINFIRDIDEDISLGRVYIPISELKKFSLTPQDFEASKLTTVYADQFSQLIRAQIEIFYSWQKEAEKGYQYIPRKFLIPIKTAAEMYKYTAWKIYRNPQIIFERKVKPSRARIFARAIIEFVRV